MPVPSLTFTGPAQHPAMIKYCAAFMAQLPLIMRSLVLVVSSKCKLCVSMEQAESPAKGQPFDLKSSVCGLLCPSAPASLPCPSAPASMQYIPANGWCCSCAFLWY
eukprot:1160717-Pelagomonas_calceolata.AAC.15